MIMWFGWIQLFIIVINGFKSTIKQMKTTRLFTIPPPSNKQTVWNVFGEIAATTGASNLGKLHLNIYKFT